MDTIPVAAHVPGNPDPVSKSDVDLSKNEVIAMIAGHRGHDRGLADKCLKSLISLLKFYEARLCILTVTQRANTGQNKDADQGTAASSSATSSNHSFTIKPEHMDDDYGAGGVRIKRERDGEGSSEGTKRRKTAAKKEREVIVLDD